MGSRKDVLQGTLDLLLLKILARERQHGWGIMQRLRQLTDDVFQITPGSLFPALRRLEDNGWIDGEWGLSENNRRARYYTLTRAGRQQLLAEQRSWKSITLAVAKVLEGS